jgi:hypothetical protein
MVAHTTQPTTMDRANNYSYSSSEADSDDDAFPEITPEEGLSAEALVALMSFQQTGSCFEVDDDTNDGNAAPLTSNTVCVAYTPNDSNVIAATLRRLHEKQASVGDVTVVHALEIPREGPIGSSESDNTTNLRKILETEGVLRINQALSADLCEQCLDYVNTKLASDGLDDESSTNDNASSGYGNVFSRNCRYDMYLRPTGVPQEALQAMLGHESVLGQLVHSLVPEGEKGIFHEFSALVSDPGSDRQPLHPDAPYGPQAPLWTVFCALQDVTIDMGATVFLLSSNTETIHKGLSNSQTTDWAEADNFRRSLLRKGDVAVMDARTLHYGDANNSDDRRVLLYFTIRNPLNGSTAADFPPSGSLWPDLEATRMSHLDYY